MTRHRALAAVVALFLVLAQVVGVAAASGVPGSGSATRSGPSAPVDKDLQRALDDGTATQLLVEFDATADLKGAKRIKDPTMRGNAVVKALKTTADVSQKTAKATVGKTKNVKATSYWLTNVLVIEGDAKDLDKLAKQLSKQKAVSQIRAPKVYPLVKPVETKIAILAGRGRPRVGRREDPAPTQAWVEGDPRPGRRRRERRYRRRLHPSGPRRAVPRQQRRRDVRPRLRLVGPDGDLRTASRATTPATARTRWARWSAATAPARSRRTSASRPARAGSRPRAARTTFCTESRCSPPASSSSRRPTSTARTRDPSLPPGHRQQLVGQRTRATRSTSRPSRRGGPSGIIPVFSSGNPGSFCGEAGSPGDFLEVVQRRRHRQRRHDRGLLRPRPVAYGKVNPDVAAPGVDVISSVPGGGYDAFSGHVDGGPPRRRHDRAHAVRRTRAASATSARRHRAVRDDRHRSPRRQLRRRRGRRPEQRLWRRPDRRQGRGRPRRRPAARCPARSATPRPTTRSPGAQVTADDGDREFTATTDTDGDYDAVPRRRHYGVSASAFGYAPRASRTSVVDGRRPRTRTSPSTACRGSPSPATSRPPRTERRSRAPPSWRSARRSRPAITDAAGFYTLTLPIGDVHAPRPAGGCTEIQIVDISRRGLTDQDIALFPRKLDDFGHGCHPIAFDWVDATSETAAVRRRLVAGRLRLPVRRSRSTARPTSRSSCPRTAT